MAIEFKPGISLAGITQQTTLAICIAHQVFKDTLNIFGKETDRNIVLTSINDGEHMPGSLHYAGNAFDIRIKDWLTEKIPGGTFTQIFFTRLKTCLGKLYDVVYEDDHIHVEYQPKNNLGA